MGDTGLIPGSGKIPHGSGKIPHAAGQLEPVLCNKVSGCHEKPAQQGVAPTCHSWRKPVCSNEDPVQPPPPKEKQWVVTANSKLDSFVIKDFIGTTGETWMQPEDLTGKHHSWHGWSDVNGWLCRGLSCSAGNIKYLRVIRHQAGKHPQMVLGGKFFLL